MGLTVALCLGIGAAFAVAMDDNLGWAIGIAIGAAIAVAIAWVTARRQDRSN